MGIWIRSQDKKKVFYAIFFAIYGNAKIYAGNTIEGEGVTGSFEVGRYESEEEALEVLSEIYNLVGNEKYYTMPQKGFIKKDRI